MTRKNESWNPNKKFLDFLVEVHFNDVDSRNMYVGSGNGSERYNFREFIQKEILPGTETGKTFYHGLVSELQPKYEKWMASQEKT